MTQIKTNHHFVSGVLQLLDNLQILVAGRSHLAERFHIHPNPELNAHLLHDIGDDDCRPEAEDSLLRQEVLRAKSLDAMLLRSF